MPGERPLLRLCSVRDQPKKHWIGISGRRIAGIQNQLELVASSSEVGRNEDLTFGLVSDVHDNF